MSTSELQARAAAAAQDLADAGRGRTIQVIADDDTDGITSAAQLAIALRRAGLKTRVRLTADKSGRVIQQALAAPDVVVVTADLGSAHLDLFKRAARPAVILDHHVPAGDTRGERIHHLNAHACGINGSTEASGATITFALVEALDPSNRDLAGLALAGAWGDRHYSGTFRGYNARLAARAAEWGVARESPGPRLSEEPLVQAFARHNDPLVAGLRTEADAEGFLAEIDVPRDALPSGLDAAERERLATALSLRLLSIGVPASSVEAFLAPRSWVKLPGGLEMPAGLVSSLANGACKEGSASDGLAFLLGDPEAANRVREARERYRARLRAGLVALEAAHLPTETGIPLLAIDHEPYTGSVASLGLRWVVPRAPGITVWAPEEDAHHAPGEPAQAGGAQRPAYAKLSLRLGTAWAGRVNLAHLVRDVAEAAGGHGGGHTLAAGCVVPVEQVEAVHAEAWRRVKAEAQRVAAAEKEVEA